MQGFYNLAAVLDNLNKKVPEDPKQVNISQTWELVRWAKELGVSEKELIRIINKVDPMVDDIKRELSKSQ